MSGRTMSMVALLSLLAAVGCTVKNSSHCYFNGGDDFCAHDKHGRLLCDQCTAENNGCVADLGTHPEDKCHAETIGDIGGTAETTTADPTSTSASSISSATMSSMSGGDASTTAADSTDGASGGSESTAGDPVCGNDLLEDGETCDGTDLGGATCDSEGLGSGELVCVAERCIFDTTDCAMQPVCGDGLIQGNEVCEGEQLEGATCETEGLVSGTLACDPIACQLDTTGCLTCGNAAIDGSDECDALDLGGQDCTDHGFAGGVLACTAECTFNLLGCNMCGNDAIDVNEECDGAALGGQDCTTQGYDSGAIGCNDLCLYDLSACVAGGDCGNGSIDGEEQCDMGNLNGETCASYSPAYGGGVLTCADNCAFDDSGCCYGLLHGCSGDGDCCSGNCGLLALALVCL